MGSQNRDWTMNTAKVVINSFLNLLAKCAKVIKSNKRVQDNEIIKPMVNCEEKYKA